MENLLSEAKKAQRNSYAPYSHFNVGSALLCKDGSIYTGCNIENASYGLTVCAERVAISNAISAGKREFVAMALVGGKNMTQQNDVFPCGACRQFLAEHCSDDFEIVLIVDGSPRIFKLGELLPNGFKL
jgi:cytidine deaminase